MPQLSRRNNQNDQQSPCAETPRSGEFLPGLESAKIASDATTESPEKSAVRRGGDQNRPTSLRRQVAQVAMSQAASLSTRSTIGSNGPPESNCVDFNSYDSSQQARFGEDPDSGIDPNLDTLTHSPEVLIATEMRENIFCAFAIWLGTEAPGHAPEHVSLDDRSATQWMEGLGETDREAYWHRLCRFQQEHNGWFHSPVRSNSQNLAPYVKYTDDRSDKEQTRPAPCYNCFVHLAECLRYDRAPNRSSCNCKTFFEWGF